MKPQMACQRPAPRKHREGMERKCKRLSSSLYNDSYNDSCAAWELCLEGPQIRTWFQRGSLAGGFGCASYIYTINRHIVLHTGRNTHQPHTCSKYDMMAHKWAAHGTGIFQEMPKRKVREGENVRAYTAHVYKTRVATSVRLRKYLHRPAREQPRSDEEQTCFKC